MSAIWSSAAGARQVEQRYRELLARWPVPAERCTVPTREGDTFAVVSGPVGAPAVLALQGSGANTAMWLPRIAELASDLRVVAVDVIGEPGLSAPSRPPLGSPAYAGWLDDVLDALALPSVAVLGVSLGGWLAVDYAARRPARVQRLAVVSPSGIGRRRVGFLLRAALLHPFGHWGRRRTLAAAMGPGARAPLDADGRAVAELALLVFRHFRPRLRVPDFDDTTLRGLDMPVLAVVGARDALIDGPHTAERLRATVPHASVRVVPDAGHLPDDGGAVLTFLRGTEVRT